MSTSIPFLCFLTDDPLHQTFCLRYWSVTEGAWTEKFDAILHESGISQLKMLEILKSSCRAYLRHFPCAGCGVPLEVRNRSQYAPASCRPIGSAYYRGVNRCGSCAAAALAEDRRASEIALEQHAARVTGALSRVQGDALPVEYSGLSYVQSFFLYSALVGANAGWAGNRLAPLESQPGELGPTPDLSQRVYKTLYEDGIISPDPASDPRVFTIRHEDGAINFSFESVGWVLAPDASGRSMKEVFSILLTRLDDPEPDAVEQIWFMVAESECRRYFLKQCERYRFFQPDIYSPKVAAVVRDFLTHYSIGQVWNVIFYVLKDMAALAQEKTYARQHVYNMIPGNLRRYFDYRLGNNKAIRPWHRPAPFTESWMSSILFDKVLGDGNTSFEMLTGQSVGAHVEFARRLPEY
jgi:hypothetical protein